MFVVVGMLHAQEGNSTKVKEEITFKLDSANLGTVEIKEIKNGLSFDKFKDKVVVLSFIAYNGKPCINLIKILNEMKLRHKDFDAFAVEMRKLEGESLKKYAKEKEINFPIIGYKKAEKFVHYIASRAGWNGTMPFIIILDKKGEVKYLQIGLIPIEGFEKAYQELK
jgi:hypothetical protein